jgi:hypothetical protein
MSRGSAVNALLFGTRQRNQPVFDPTEAAERFIEALVGKRPQRGDPFTRIEAATADEQWRWREVVLAELPTIIGAIPRQSEGFTDDRPPWSVIQLSRLAAWSPTRIEAGQRGHLGQLFADTRSSFGATPERASTTAMLIGSVQQQLAVVASLNNVFIGDQAIKAGWWANLESEIADNISGHWADLVYLAARQNSTLDRFSDLIHPADQQRLQRRLAELSPDARKRLQRARQLDGEALRPSRTQLNQASRAWTTAWLAGQTPAQAERRAGNVLFRELRAAAS